MTNMFKRRHALAHVLVDLAVPSPRQRLPLAKYYAPAIHALPHVRVNLAVRSPRQRLPLAKNYTFGNTALRNPCIKKKP